MSVDYVLYLRDAPDLERIVAELDPYSDSYPSWGSLLERVNERDWAFAGAALEVRPYQPTTDDALAGTPWRAEIAWVIETGAASGVDHADELLVFCAALLSRYRGALLDPQTKELRWYWWDRDALAGLRRALRAVARSGAQGDRRQHVGF